MKLQSERTVVTVASAIALVSAVIKEIAGNEVADTLEGNFVTDEIYSQLISSEINKNVECAWVYLI